MNTPDSLQPIAAEQSPQTLTLFAVGGLVVSALIIARDPATRELGSRLMRDTELRTRLLRAGQIMFKILD